jgi:hypothetical protein
MVDAAVHGAALNATSEFYFMSARRYRPSRGAALDAAGKVSHRSPWIDRAPLSRSRQSAAVCTNGARDLQPAPVNS